jgi:hypothetical protein
VPKITWILGIDNTIGFLLQYTLTVNRRVLMLLELHSAIDGPNTLFGEAHVDNITEAEALVERCLTTHPEAECFVLSVNEEPILYWEKDRDEGYLYKYKCCDNWLKAMQAA